MVQDVNAFGYRESGAHLPEHVILGNAVYLLERYKIVCLYVQLGCGGVNR